MQVKLKQESFLKTIKDIEPELQLLIYCSRTKIDSKTTDKIYNLLNQKLDWNYVIKSAYHNKVLSLLYFNLNHKFSKFVPRQILTKLRSFYHSNSLRNSFLTKELASLLQVFEQNNIQAIPFKGAILASSVYGNLALRQFDDLDILVKKKDFLKAKKLLTSQQYQLQLTELEAIFVSQHAFQSPFQNHNGIVNIDLHWGIAPRRPKSNSRFNCLWENLEPVSLADKQVLSFSPESTLTIQCINAVKEPFKPLLIKQICDIAEIIQAYPYLNWSKILLQAKQLGCQRLILIALYLTHKIYETPLPDEVMEIILSIAIVQKLTEEFEQLFFQQAENTGKLLVDDSLRNKYIMQTTDPQDKPLYFIDKIVTPHSKDLKFISLSSSFYFLYYLVRPIRLASELFNNFSLNPRSRKIN